MSRRKELAGIRVGDLVTATGRGDGIIKGVVVEINTYKGFLIADTEGRVEPQWYTLSSLSKRDR